VYKMNMNMIQGAGRISRAMTGGRPAGQGASDTDASVMILSINQHQCRVCIFLATTCRTAPFMMDGGEGSSSKPFGTITRAGVSVSLYIYVYIAGDASSHR